MNNFKIILKEIFKYAIVGFVAYLFMFYAFIVFFNGNDKQIPLSNDINMSFESFNIDYNTGVISIKRPYIYNKNVSAKSLELSPFSPYITFKKLVIPSFPGWIPGDFQIDFKKILLNNIRWNKFLSFSYETDFSKISSNINYNYIDKVPVYIIRKQKDLEISTRPKPGEDMISLNENKATPNIHISKISINLKDKDMSSFVRLISVFTEKNMQAAGYSQDVIKNKTLNVLGRNENISEFKGRLISDLKKLRKSIKEYNGNSASIEDLGAKFMIFSAQGFKPELDITMHAKKDMKLTIFQIYSLSSILSLSKIEESLFDKKIKLNKGEI